MTEEIQRYRDRLRPLIEQYAGESEIPSLDGLGIGFDGLPESVAKVFSDLCARCAMDRSAFYDPASLRASLLLRDLDRVQDSIASLVEGPSSLLQWSRSALFRQVSEEEIDRLLQLLTRSRFARSELTETVNVELLAAAKEAAERLAQLARGGNDVPLELPSSSALADVLERVSSIERALRRFLLMETEFRGAQFRDLLIRRAVDSLYASLAAEDNLQRLAAAASLEALLERLLLSPEPFGDLLIMEAMSDPEEVSVVSEFSVTPLPSTGYPVQVLLQVDTTSPAPQIGPSEFAAPVSIRPVDDTVQSAGWARVQTQVAEGEGSFRGLPFFEDGGFFNVDPSEPLDFVDNPDPLVSAPSTPDPLDPAHLDNLGLGGTAGAFFVYEAQATSWDANGDPDAAEWAQLAAGTVAGAYQLNLGGPASSLGVQAGAVIQVRAASSDPWQTFGSVSDPSSEWVLPAQSPPAVWDYDSTAVYEWRALRPLSAGFSRLSGPGTGLFVGAQVVLVGSSGLLPEQSFPRTLTEVGPGFIEFDPPIASSLPNWAVRTERVPGSAYVRYAGDLLPGDLLYTEKDGDLVEHRVILSAGAAAYILPPLFDAGTPDPLVTWRYRGARAGYTVTARPAADPPVSFTLVPEQAGPTLEPLGGQDFTGEVLLSFSPAQETQRLLPHQDGDPVDIEADIRRMRRALQGLTASDDLLEQEPLRIERLTVLWRGRPTGAYLLGDGTIQVESRVPVGAPDEQATLLLRQGDVGPGSGLRVVDNRIGASVANQRLDEALLSDLASSRKALIERGENPAHSDPGAPQPEGRIVFATPVTAAIRGPIAAGGAPQYGRYAWAWRRVQDRQTPDFRELREGIGRALLDLGDTRSRWAEGLSLAHGDEGFLLSGPSSWAPDPRLLEGMDVDIPGLVSGDVPIRIKAAYPVSGGFRVRFQDRRMQDSAAAAPWSGVTLFRTPITDAWREIQSLLRYHGYLRASLEAVEGAARPFLAQAIEDLEEAGHPAAAEAVRECRFTDWVAGLDPGSVAGLEETLESVVSQLLDEGPLPIDEPGNDVFEE